MIDVSHDAECRFFNTLPLSSLLQEADTPFRQAVIGALIREGFELDESSPCLQHPMEILEAIHGLETHGFGSTWESFQQALLTAEKLGILLDMSIRKTKARQAPTSLQSSGRAVGCPRPQFELA